MILNGKNSLKIPKIIDFKYKYFKFEKNVLHEIKLPRFKCFNWTVLFCSLHKIPMYFGYVLTSVELFTLAEFITSVRRYAIFLLLVFWKKHFNVIVYPCFSITIINWWPLSQQYKYRRNSTTSSMYWWRRCGQNGFWSVATLIYRQLLDTSEISTTRRLLDL